MKTNAVIRIIIWTLVALLLTGVLVSVLALRSIDFGGIFNIGENIGVYYPDENSYTVGDGEVSAEISGLQINWVAGSITVNSYDGDKIQIKETGADTEDDSLRYRIDDGKLIIQYRKSAKRWALPTKFRKDLTVLIPNGMANALEDVKINNVSSDILIRGLTLSGETEIDSVSGEIKLEKISSGEISINNVSGRMILSETSTSFLDVYAVSGILEAEGDLKKISVNTVSGNIKILPGESLERLDVEAISSKVDLKLKEGNFSLKHSTASGKFTCDFPTKTEGGRYISGDGSIKINIDTVSGNVNISQE